MMNIGVIGYGVVGRATAEVLRRLGHAVAVRDADTRRTAEARDDGYRSLRQHAQLDVLFLCVPEGQLHEALASSPYCSITVVRSTVPPGTTDRLSEQLGRPLAFIPETLKEATALWDALNPAFVLVGCRDDVRGEVLVQLFAPLMVPITVVPPPIAEMAKLTLNAYLHTLISFWNEIDGICGRIGIPSHVVGRLCSQDPRVAPYGATMHGQPVGGRCLPKDLAQLIDFAHDRGSMPDLLMAAQRANNELAARTNVVAGPDVSPAEASFVRVAEWNTAGAGARGNGDRM